jgi:GTP-binding protein EngB required for normal cell division
MKPRISASHPEPPTVVLIGKIGHGKTRLLNQICGTSFTSEMCPTSCTKVVQCGLARQRRLRVIDTPGFFASDNIQDHITHQKRALEEKLLSGVYIVSKIARVDDLAETISKMMDFVGSDEVRVIVTNIDVIEDEQGFDIDETKHHLSLLLGIPETNIAAFGNSTEPEAIENFIWRTLHYPKRFEVSREQSIYFSTFCVGGRKYYQDVVELGAKIEASSKVCGVLIEGRGFVNGYLLDLTRNATRDMVARSELSIIHAASNDLTAEELLLLRDKIRTIVSIPYANFEKLTRDFLSNDFHGRNQSSYSWSSKSPRVKVEFSISPNNTSAAEWIVLYRLDDSLLSVHDARSKMHDYVCGAFRAREGKSESSENHKRRKSSSTDVVALSSNGVASQTIQRAPPTVTSLSSPTTSERAISPHKQKLAAQLSTRPGSDTIIQETGSRNRKNQRVYGHPLFPSKLDHDDDIDSFCSSENADRKDEIQCCLWITISRLCDFFQNCRISRTRRKPLGHSLENV